MWKLSLSNGEVSRLTRFEGRRGDFGDFAADSHYLYFTWRDDDGDHLGHGCGEGRHQVIHTTRDARTAGGKLAVGKVNKLRSDVLFLVLAERPKSLVGLTEEDIYQFCLKEQQSRASAEVHRVPLSGAN